MIKKIIKKIIPAQIIEYGWRIITKLMHFILSFKFKPLIIRRGTTDCLVFRSIFVRGELKLPIDFEPKLIVDGGAYTGLSTLYYATEYPDAEIVAVEPENSNYLILEANTKKISNVKRIKAGLWHKKAYLKVIDKNLGKWGFAVKEVDENNEYDIQAVTINSILEHTGYKYIDILKLDIEGAERELFANNPELWLTQVNIIVIELHDWLRDGCSQAFYSAFNRSEWNEYKEGEKVVMIRKQFLVN
jgi:FkbM family methyltransferase